MFFVEVVLEMCMQPTECTVEQIQYATVENNIAAFDVHRSNILPFESEHNGKCYRFVVDYASETLYYNHCPELTDE